MSKLISQSRTLLPMVIKKSPLDTVHILETHPTVAAKLVLPPTKKEASEKEIPTAKEHIKEKITQTQSPKTLHVACSEDFAVKTIQKRTLARGLVMDLMQLQGWLAKMLARGHMWMFRQDLGLLRGLEEGPAPSPRMVFLEGQPLVKEDVPNSILPEHSKSSPMNHKHPEIYAVKKGEVNPQKKSDSKSSPMKSNFVDVLLERSPEWQKSISASLGALQKKVLNKFPK